MLSISCSLDGLVVWFLRMLRASGGLAVSLLRMLSASGLSAVSLLRMLKAWKTHFSFIFFFFFPGGPAGGCVLAEGMGSEASASGSGRAVSCSSRRGKEAAAARLR